MAVGLGALESMLVDYAITAIVVTHDRWFLDRVATSILAFEGDGKVTRYPGNYDTYRRLRAQADKRVAPEPEAAPAPAARAPRRKKALGFAEARELESLPDTIAGAEARVAELTAVLGDPASYAEGGADIQQTTADLAAARSEVDRLLERWAELEMKKEADQQR